MFLLETKNVFQEIREEDWKDGLKFIFPLLLFFNILSGIVYAFTNVSNPTSPLIKMTGWFFGGIIGAPIIFILVGLCYHVGVLLFGGGNNNGWSKTVNVTFYSEIPLLLVGWIPIIGLFAWLWGWGILIIGLKEIHELSTIRAFFATVGIGIIIIIMVIVYAIIGASVFALNLPS